MKKLEVNPAIQEHVEKMANDFRQSMKMIGIDANLSSVTFQSPDCAQLNCPCGCHYIIDRATNTVTGAECNRCPPRPRI